MQLKTYSKSTLTVTKVNKKKTPPQVDSFNQVKLHKHQTKLRMKKMKTKNKGVFRTQTNIYGGDFCLQPLFSQKAASQMFASVLNTPPKKIWSVNLASESRKFFYPTIFMLPLLSFIYIHLIQGNELVSQCIQFFPEIHAFFISNAFFAAQPHCSLTFHELSFKCCLSFAYVQTSSYRGTLYFLYVSFQVYLCLIHMIYFSLSFSLYLIKQSH